MRLLVILMLCAGLVGCQTVQDIKESGGDHPVAYLGVQAAMQMAAYQYARKLDPKDYDKVEAIVEALNAVVSPEDPTVYDWERGRAVIAAKVPQPYTMGALLVYGIVETELKGQIDQGNVTVEVAEKYIGVSIIGVKNALAQVKSERG